LALGVALTGCSGTGKQASTPSAPATATASQSTAASARPALSDATDIARAIEAKVSSVTKVITLTEDNDSNNLIGRPNGYMSAAVLTDKAGDRSDTDPGVAYGATVEVFATQAGAKSRSKYMQGILKDAPVLGTEYDFVSGRVLLRVSGELKPSAAQGYQDTFRSLF
jgi:hypothetical protein